MTWPTPDEVARLETAVIGLLDGSTDGPEVLGYGEISTVVLLETPDGAFAAKRLPPFGDSASIERYAEVFGAYLARLPDRGVVPLPTRLLVLPGGVAYCVQPLADPEQLATRVLAAADEDEGRSLLARIVAAVAAAISQRVGLDAQLSNWVVGPGGELRYLDVTTPLLRDAAGAEGLDTEVFLASLPWALRRPVRAFFLDEILSHYYTPRAALVDLTANLVKEGLASWVETTITIANTVVQPPITDREVRRYYRSDAAMWALLQRLRRLDRWWQRRVRRRRYRFLLPGRIDR